MKVLSLFSNIGVAEAYLDEIGFDVVVANEVVPKRASLYKKIYPKTNMICGDITDPIVRMEIVEQSLKNSVDVVIATPPCQGMSTVGKQKKSDVRNELITYAIDVIQKVQPKYIFIENVPAFLKTEIVYRNRSLAIETVLMQALENRYTFNMKLINTALYGVPQRRERMILLLTRKDCTPVWEFPKPDSKITTLQEVIGNLPSIDPWVTDISESEMISLFPQYFKKEKEALKVSIWHKPPHHIKRQVIAMMHTPTGKSAFENKKYYPRKKDGSAVKGYKNTYKRQSWDKPAYTVTMDNRKISSQDNVHPGRCIKEFSSGEVIYSDPRVLTVYEIMKVMSIPESWPVPEDTSEAFLRSVIGEGVPPLFVKRVFEQLI